MDTNCILNIDMKALDGKVIIAMNITKLNLQEKRPTDENTVYIQVHHFCSVT